jgi:hypothetical protein
MRRVIGMADLQSLIDVITAADPHSVPDGALLAEISDLLCARDRLDAAINTRLQVSEVRGTTVTECGRTTRGWLVEERRLCPEEAGRRIRIGWAMVNHPALAAAALAGQISMEHARVIDTTLRKIPSTSHDVVETNLLAAAQAADPITLGQLGRQIRIMLDSDLSAEEAAQRQYDSRWMVMNRTFRGMLHLEAMLDPESAAILEAAIGPLMAKLGDEDLRDAKQRRADALTDLATYSLEHGDLPDHNGERPQIMVTIPYSELRDGIEAGQLPTATINGTTPITPDNVRRLACDANLIPAVLGSNSEVLDLGQSTPTWSRAQRRARRIEDKGCTFPKCQAPLSRCQIHHLKFLRYGGPTDKANGTHLCHFHHWLVHHKNWTITRNAAGHIEVHRT